jgi:hypothetical protein
VNGIPIKCGILDISPFCRSPRPVIGIASPFIVLWADMDVSEEVVLNVIINIRGETKQRRRNEGALIT